MITKSVARRTQHALAGKRLPLPGHSRFREQQLRAEFAEHFDPKGPIEMIWVNDVAYASMTIENFRAQIAAVHHQLLLDAVASRYSFPGLVLDRPGFGEDTRFSADELAEIEELQDSGFVAPHGGSLLDNDVFVKLLGQISPEQDTQLVDLRRSLREEKRERDRLINQIDRTRRAAMRFAVEMAGARQRAAQEGYTIAGLFEDQDDAANAVVPRGEDPSGNASGENGVDQDTAPGDEA